MKMLKLLQFIAPFPDSDILVPVRNSTGSRCVKKGVRKEKKSELSASRVCGKKWRLIEAVPLVGNPCSDGVFLFGGEHR